MSHKQLVTDKPKPIGRPTSYTNEIANEICDRLAEGEGLIAITRSPHIPSMKTIFNWLDKPEHAEFLHRYTQAKARCAEALFFKQQEIAENSQKETIGPDRLKVEVYDRMAAKLAPTKYSEKYMAASISNENNRINQLNVTFLVPDRRPEPVTIDHEPVEGMADTASAEQDD